MNKIQKEQDKNVNEKVNQKNNLRDNSNDNCCKAKSFVYNQIKKYLIYKI